MKLEEIARIGEYRPPWFLPGAHLQTIYPAMFRKVELIAQCKERIDTPDDDFLDLDWGRMGNSRLAIICHGLEGHSRSRYVQGMARAMLKTGWDVLCWNYRGCSGEPNRLLRSYHSGSIDDLDTVIEHAKSVGQFRRIGLIGFSLGGNLILKYAGELGREMSDKAQATCVFSTPCDLEAASLELAKPSNAYYMRRFLKSLGKKVVEKERLHPGSLELSGLEEMRTFEEFDDRFTAPLNGFRNARDYWSKCSCLPVLDRIQVPSLIVNAMNDPFLPEACFPRGKAKKNPALLLETPRHGGHVGFPLWNGQNEYWSETRAALFIESAV